MRLGNDRLRKRYFCECNLSGVVVVVEDSTVSVFVQGGSLLEGLNYILKMKMRDPKIIYVLNYKEKSLGNFFY